MQNMLHVDLLVPLAGNDGRPFQPLDFLLFESFLLDVASGFTRRGIVDGAWRSSEGEVFFDQSRAYSVSVPVSGAEDAVRKIDTYIRTQFQQQAAFVELLPTRATAF
jgi:hypothetical protein